MSNALYDKGRQAFGEKSIGWVPDTIKIQLVSTSLYTVNLSSHEFLSDVPSSARVGTPAILSGKTFTNGVADADDVTFTSVPTTPAGALIIYKDTGDESTSNLIAYIDTGAGLPESTGGTVNVVFSDGADKIFKL